MVFRQSELLSGAASPSLWATGICSFSLQCLGVRNVHLLFLVSVASFLLFFPLPSPTPLFFWSPVNKPVTYEFFFLPTRSELLRCVCPNWTIYTAVSKFAGPAFAIKVFCKRGRNTCVGYSWWPDFSSFKSPTPPHFVSFSFFLFLWSGIKVGSILFFSLFCSFKKLYLCKALALFTVYI